MGLIDHEQAALAEQGRQLGGEAGIGEPLRGNEQHVEPPGAQVVEHARPLVDVGGVDGGRPQPGPRGGGDLVTHQRQQWRHDQRRPDPQLA